MKRIYLSEMPYNSRTKVLFVNDTPTLELGFNVDAFAMTSDAFLIIGIGYEYHYRILN
jgi:hypothetical protein